jgi:hypothetical protein
MFSQPVARSLYQCVFPTLAILLTMPLAAQATEFRVNVTLDLADANIGDGVCSAGPAAGETEACSLRAAIMEANALGGPTRHVIHLPAGLYQLTRRHSSGFAGLEEDDRQLANVEGAMHHDALNDLDIGVDLEILGAGENRTIVAGFAIDRVFHVLNRTLGEPGAPRFVRFADLTIRGGRSLQRGSGVFIERVREAFFEDVTIEDNRGTAFFELNGEVFASMGGGIFSQAYDLFLTRCTLRNNFATVGGGLSVAAGWATIRDTTFDGNEARSPGSGAPGVVGASSGLGGGIAMHDSPASPTFLVMTGSTLTGNSATNGGGLGAWGGVSVVNSTFSGNSASFGGGAAYIRTPLSARLSHFEFTTIVGNTARDGGGIFREIFVTSPTHQSRFSIARSIVADNTGGNCALPALVPRSISGGNNLESGDTCGFTATTDLRNTPPQIGPLGDNGGPTATHALSRFSPAINAAGRSSYHVDQRGTSRPHGAAMDIGAYEFTMPMLMTDYRVPGRFETLFGFSVRIEIQGTSGAKITEVVPAMEGLKLSIEIDKSGRAATVSASGLKIDVNALKKHTRQKQPALFHVGADTSEDGSDLLVISNQRFDATLAEIAKLPLGQK